MDEIHDTIWHSMSEYSSSLFYWTTWTSHARKLDTFIALIRSYNGHIIMASNI